MKKENKKKSFNGESKGWGLELRTMNENARQRQNPRAKGSFGGSAKPSVQGPKQRGAPKLQRGAIAPKPTGGPRRREPRKLRSSLPLTTSRPAHPRWEEKPPQSGPRPTRRHRPRGGAGRGQGAAPCQGGPTTTILSRDGAAPRPLPWAPQAEEEGQQPQQRGPTDPPDPQSPCKAGGTEPLTSFLHTWLQERGVVTQSQSVTGGEGRDASQLMGTPDPHTPQSGGIDPP